MADNNKRELLLLIQDHSRELRNLSHSCGYEFLTYLLGMAMEEATLQMDRKDREEPGKTAQTNE